MSTEAENLAFVQRFVDDVWIGKNWNHVGQYFADEHTIHDPSYSSVKTGPEGYKEYALHTPNAFPDLTSHIDDIFACGDKVVLRWSSEGTHQGTHLHGHAPSHKRAKMQGISIFRIAGGKIVENWDVTDTHGMLHQLGHIPKSGA